jgi:hypothetical protein
VPLFRAIGLAPVTWGKLLTLLIVATVTYIAFRQWTINARHLRLERIQGGTIFSLARTLISIASGILLSTLAFVLPGRSHDPSEWRFIPELPGFLVAAFTGGLHDPDVRQFKIKVLFLNAVLYGLIVFSCYPHFIRRRK